ncbi:MAG: choloylglycine hydrolase [Bacteroidales bacterium]|nr:choloylglycine hydrolase [Bacteroidales bacterium]
MSRVRPFYRKKRFLLPLALILLFGGLVILYVVDTSVSPPMIRDRSPLSWQVSEPDSGLFICEGNWLKQNKYGLWELFVQGSPFERGVANGKLTKELIAFQEEAFVNRLREMIPSDSYLKFLRYFIYWFNRDLDEYLMPEFKEEIYGISFSADPRYNFIGSPYQRMLNYHSAHDIGHALQDLMLVGCTSFGVWNSMSADSSLLIGRNFDFYMGDDFARNPIVCFEKPDTGYPFAMITWGGMTGAVSGMNMAGITVTINAAKSDIPFSARTPVSLLAREILQYASSVEDAWSIAGQRETFVSESLLIGSGKENRAAIIEKSPFGLTLIQSRKDYIMCTNHYQGDLFRDDPHNSENIKNSASYYRSRRVIRLITELSPMDAPDAATLLRDQKGINGTTIGMGNEKAINQLIAHHSVMFKPGELLMWVSTPPWQLGPYICYNLSEIFHTFATLQTRMDIADSNRLIPMDQFVVSSDFQQFLLFRKQRADIRKLIETPEMPLPERSYIEDFTATNPGYFEVWSLAGDLYSSKGAYQDARIMYQKALSMEIPAWQQKEPIIRKLVDCMYNIKTAPE